MKRTKIDGIWYPVTVSPPRAAKGATVGKRSTVTNGRHFALALPCYASHIESPDATSLESTL